MPEKTFLTEGIVLSSMPYLEADAILRLLTPEHGLVSAVARGARRPTSKRAGKLQPFARVTLQLHRGRTLSTVVQVDSIDLHPRIAGSYERTLAADAACELAAKAVQEGQPVPVFYRMLAGFLARVDREGPAGAMVRALSFELGSLGVLGFEPRLLACAVCGAPIDGEAGVDLARGGLVCAACGADEAAETFDAETVRFMQRLFRSAGAFVAAPAAASAAAGAATRRALVVDERRVRATFAFLTGYLRDHLGIELRSNRLLEEALVAWARTAGRAARGASEGRTPEQAGGGQPPEQGGGGKTPERAEPGT